MGTVTLAQAKARLSELIHKVEGGEELVITRRGRPVARVCSVSRPKQAPLPLAQFRARMPKWRKPSAKLLRELRNEAP